MKIIYLDSGRMPTEKAHGYQIMKMCEAFAQAKHGPPHPTGQAETDAPIYSPPYQGGDKEGVEVELIVSRRRNPIKTDPFEYYGVKRNFKITRLPSLDVVNIVPKYGSWISRMSFLLAAKIYLAFRHYDLLYIREHMTGLFFRNFILEVHTLPRRIVPRDLRIWRKAKKIVVITRFLKERLVAAGVRDSKIIVAPDAVDLEIFDLEMSKAEARKTLGLPQTGIILGYTGSLKTNEMEKGISTVLRALVLLPEDYKLIAVGGFSRHIREYQTLADSLNISARVEFRKRVELAELALYQKAFDVLLLPFPKNDHYAYFTSPLKLFEYMASNRPIVATDLPSLREVLTPSSSPPHEGEGGNAVLVPPDDPEALARGIAGILADQELAKKIVEQAREDVRLYTWQNRAKVVLSELP